MRALIIEDETILAFMIEDCLDRLGFREFCCAAREEEAVETALAFKPDLITVDARLADGSGVAAALKIAKHLTTAVVFVTGNAAQVRNCVHDPIIVEKPFVYESLATAVMLARSAPGVRPAVEGA